MKKCKYWKYFQHKLINYRKTYQYQLGISNLKKVNRISKMNKSFFQ